MTIKKLIFSSVVILSLISSQLFAQNWPSFRGPNASGVADNQNLPIRWNVDTSENIRWRTKLPGFSHASPVVWGHRVFGITSVSSRADASFQPVIEGIGMSNDVQQQTWKLYALEKTTGKILWETVAHEGIPRTKRHIKSSHSNATPATNGEVIVAIMGSEGLFCYEVATGKLRWKNDLGLLDIGLLSDPSSHWGHASSPIIHDNMVIVQLDRRQEPIIAAYHLENGREMWQIARNDKNVWATPVVHEAHGRTQLIANGGNFIRGYDLETREELWRFADEAEVKTPTPVVADGLVYISGGWPPGREIKAVKASASGQVSSDNEALAWISEKGGPYIVTPVVYKGYLYSTTDSGIISCYDARTGERLYRQRLSGGQSASPVASDDKIYFSGMDGVISVVKAGSEYELLAENTMDEPVMSTPALSDGLFILRTRDSIFAIGR